MESAVAPSIANLYMTAMETDTILTSQNPYFQDMIVYRHCIDDLLIIYKGKTSFPNFLQWINSLDSNLKFMGQSDRQQIPFLDTSIYRDTDNVLAFRPYKKPTDRNTYLHYKSFHPSHLLNNLPYGQFLRLKWNSTSSYDYMQECQALQQQLIVRGYPQTTIKKARIRADSIPRHTLLKDKLRIRDNRISWAIDYTPHANRIRKIIMKHWHLVQDIPGCMTPPQVGMRCTRNVRNVIIRTVISKSQEVDNERSDSLPMGHFKCHRCKACPTVMPNVDAVFRLYKINFLHVGLKGLYT